MGITFLPAYGVPGDLSIDSHIIEHLERFNAMDYTLLGIDTPDWTDSEVDLVLKPKYWGRECYTITAFVLDYFLSCDIRLNSDIAVLVGKLDLDSLGACAILFRKYSDWMAYDMPAPQDDYLRRLWHVTSCVKSGAIAYAPDAAVVTASKAIIDAPTPLEFKVRDLAKWIYCNILPDGIEQAKQALMKEYV